LDGDDYDNDIDEQNQLGLVLASRKIMLNRHQSN
jgi:hypothetical protein